MSYKAPVGDLLDTLFAASTFGQEPPENLDRETAEAVLNAAGRFAESVLSPLNRVGDRQGARLTPQGVVASPGFAEAYRALSEDGWVGLSAPDSEGGQGLPKALTLAVYELFQAANMAFALCPMLTQSAIDALSAHGDAEQKAVYLPHLVSGRWTGAMALTEAQAGSDLGALTCRAEPDSGGLYRLFGQKIYITWGDHDCAENIVHLVLARLPGAPEGPKGISLFLAAKRVVGEDGALGPPDNFKAIGLEEKLGIHGSPTCVIQYDGTHAELVGPAHGGLAAMFTMMNAARLHVAVQGVAIADRAFQQALAYAQERRQGRSALTGQSPAPLFDHPDIRRQLILMKARVQGGRALCLAAAGAADRAGSDVAARLREELLTPIAKAWCTDLGVETASMGVQIHGGAGYIEDTGAAQHLRDARIAPIYEGTNAIQAQDLAFRKLPMAGGQAVADLLADIGRTIDALAAHPDPRLRKLGVRLADAKAQASALAQWLTQQGRSADALAGASPFLTLMGDLCVGALLCERALHASAADGDTPPLTVILASAFAEADLVRAGALAAAATQGADLLAAVSADQLAG